MENYNASQFVIVSKTIDGELLELPTDPEDNTLSIHTLRAAFPDAHGLKYIIPGIDHFRTLLVDDTATKFFPPPGGWGIGEPFIVMSDPVMYEWSPTQNSIVERALSPHPFHPLSAQQMLQQDESMVQSSSSGIVRHPVFSNSTNCYTNFLPNIEPMVPLSLAEVNNIHLGKEVKCEIDPPNDTANNSDDSYSDHQASARVRAKTVHPPKMPAKKPPVKRGVPFLASHLCGTCVRMAPKTAQEESKGPSRSVPPRKAADAARLAMKEQNQPLNYRYIPRSK